MLTLPALAILDRNITFIDQIFQCSNVEMEAKKGFINAFNLTQTFLHHYFYQPSLHFCVIYNLTLVVVVNQQDITVSPTAVVKMKSTLTGVGSEKRFQNCLFFLTIHIFSFHLRLSSKELNRLII